jgi:hypothetical protein
MEYVAYHERIKVKYKIILVLNEASCHEQARGCGGIASFFDEVSAAFPQGESPRYPLDRRLAGKQGLFVCKVGFVICHFGKVR